MYMINENVSGPSYSMGGSTGLPAQAGTYESTLRTLLLPAELMVGESISLLYVGVYHMLFIHINEKDV